MDPEGNGVPLELVALAVGRARGWSATYVDALPEEDVLDEMMWIDIEARVQRQARDELEKERRRRG